MDKKLKIIVADPCYDHKGLSTPVIPLGAGLVAAHTKKYFPKFQVDVFKAVSPLIEKIKKDPPDVIGLTNYLWNNNSQNIGLVLLFYLISLEIYLKEI